MSWVAVGAAVISAAAGIYSSVESANAQNDAIEAQYKIKEAQTKVEQEQIAEQTALDKFDVTREALRARAKARVSGAESGVLGTNFTKIMTEADMDELFELGKLDVKQDNAVEQGQMELEAQKVAGSTSAAEVSTVGAGLQIIGAAGSAYVAGGGTKKNTGGSKNTTTKPNTTIKTGR